eukprot:11206526-Lingulodinium_polyedra.AAC.1
MVERDCNRMSKQHCAQNCLGMHTQPHPSLATLQNSRFAYFTRATIRGAQMTHVNRGESDTAMQERDSA